MLAIWPAGRVWSKTVAKTAHLVDGKGIYSLSAMGRIRSFTQSGDFLALVMSATRLLGSASTGIRRPSAIERPHYRVTGLDISPAHVRHHDIPLDLCSALKQDAHVSSTFSSKKIDSCSPQAGIFFALRRDGREGSPPIPGRIDGA